MAPLPLYNGEADVRRVKKRRTERSPTRTTSLVAVSVRWPCHPPLEKPPLATPPLAKPKPPCKPPSMAARTLRHPGAG
jgi:hypothetical protein